MKMHWITMATAMSLTGCASVMPELPEQKIDLPERYTTLQGELGPVTIRSMQQLSRKETIPQQWWRLYKSPQLTRLVETGLKNSPTVTAAEARLKAAEALYRSEIDSVQLPTVNLALNGTRTQTSGAALGTVGHGTLVNVDQATLQMSYRVDLVGGEAAKVRSKQAFLLLEQYRLEQARVALAANIVAVAIEIASLEAQMGAFGKIVEDESEQLAVTEQQYQIGVIPKSDLLSQRASLAQTRTEMPPMEKALLLARHQLALLLGGTAPEVKLDGLLLSEMTLPETLPLTLPSALTRQRADVLAAEALLLQQAAAVGIAAANRYPTLDLSASYGTEGNQLSDLFSGGSIAWGLGAGLLHPLFHGEALAAKEQAALELFNAEAANYRQTVLSAFREVSDALRTLQLDTQQMSLTREADQLAEETLALVRQQHRQGAVSYLTLLNAQRQMQQARIQAIQSRAALYRDSAALIVALGGGWWNPVEDE